MPKKTPLQDLEEHSVAERDLTSQRRLRVAETSLRVEKSKLLASEKEVAELRQRVELLTELKGVKASKKWKSPKSSGRPGEATAVLLLLCCQQAFE